ncbi:hypothetical protein [Thioalkalivibrio thiocyanodenitrificans]|uniref:hypothetical protein n=1 Tax=Thioalkalivibrio thiocyanodenitrificans TaxID=243063 RepID=UPI000371BA39|nr:hypothetical protein [Thioalkalivibrio thiocyanodenitrificans]
MSESVNVDERPLVQRAIAVLWPSFLVAGVATVLLFTWVDPAELSQCLDGMPAVTRMEAYSVGFFILWLFAATASALTCYFGRPPGR